MFEFKIGQKLLGSGRTGVFTTPHGDVHTPVFMPVGTQASIKSVSPLDLEKIGAQVVLANNYHLFLRPGSDVIARLGGLHSFMNWPKPILTDSGGFQVWSLSRLVKIKDDGVEFRSHIDGSPHFLSPEIAVTSQIQLGGDIIMAFDQCTSDTASKDEAATALELTHSWLTRSVRQWQEHETSLPTARQALFGIIQGALHQDLRREAAQFVVSQNLPGIAIGGETIGYNMAGTKQVIDWIRDLLPSNKPRYTMGLGCRLSDVLTAISLGIDMFDCVAPTRLARNGALYTGRVIVKNNQYFFDSPHPNERINIGNQKFATDTKPIDENCDCPTCQHFTRAYLHHLYRSRELLYYNLASVHNLRMMIKTVSDAISLSP